MPCIMHVFHMTNLRCRMVNNNSKVDFKFKHGDCVYYIFDDEYYGEIEVEGWIQRPVEPVVDISDPVYVIKLRSKPKQVIFKKESELVQIYPDYWEEMPEDIDKDI